MIKNYFKIAWRNIVKNKVFSFINIIGLTIGLSASFVIGLMVFYDATFDDFHQDGDRIYRIVSDFKAPQGTFYNSGVTLALKDAIAGNSNLESVVEFYINRPSKVENKTNNLEFKWPNFVMYTDEGYFDIFKYSFLAGDKSTALDKPNTVILTQSRAKQYFPSLTPNDIIGKTLVYNDSINITVSGIVENLKNRSDLVFEEFISHPTLLQTERRQELLDRAWNNTNSDSQLFVKLAEAGSLNPLKKQLDDLAIKHTDEDDKKYGTEREFQLQPLDDIHFNENYGIYDWERARANKSLLKNLALVALFLLLLGCINFINLNTAQASQRSKEIGIRKTLGSSRKQLIKQFLGETFLLVLFSALLSIGLTKWLINVFSDFVPEGLTFSLFKNPMIIIGIIIVLVIVTFLSGFYPALVLSKFNTVSVLKNHINSGENKVKLRKILTIFQFTIAQVFIIGTLLVDKQINFLLNKDMGFKTDAIVSIFSPRSEGELSKKEIYAQKLRAIPGIKSVSLGGHAPASYSSNTTNVTYIDGDNIIKSEMQFLFATFFSQETPVQLAYSMRSTAKFGQEKL